MVDDFTTIAISNTNKDRLDKIKIHDREPYDDVLIRLLDMFDKARK